METAKGLPKEHPVDSACRQCSDPDSQQGSGGDDQRRGQHGKALGHLSQFRRYAAVHPASFSLVTPSDVSTESSEHYVLQVAISSHHRQGFQQDANLAISRPSLQLGIYVSTFLDSIRPPSACRLSSTR